MFTFYWKFQSLFGNTSHWKNWHPTKTHQSICITNQLASFHMRRTFSVRYFQKDIKTDLGNHNSNPCRHKTLKTSKLRRLEDVQFTTSWKRVIYNVLRTFDLGRLEDVQFITSWRRLIYYVLKTSDLRCLEDVQFKVSLQDVFKTKSVYQRRNNIYTTSMKMIFPYFVLSEIFRTF